MERKEEQEMEMTQKSEQDNPQDVPIDGESNDVDNDRIWEDGDYNKTNGEIRELNDRFLRLQADFINYKSRVNKERERIFAYATEDIVVQLLPILDNFNRALQNEKEEDRFYQGVKMIYNQILEVLKKNGLKEIECIGEPFDPNFHHAVFVEEVENKEEGIILEVLQRGYLLKDKVIRPSMVKVAK